MGEVYHKSVLQEKDELQPEPLTQPFENIALAFSGGGFRAASFTLGVLSYLEQLEFYDHLTSAKNNLLKKVRYLSSASGGTIATSLYALHTVKFGNRSFQLYYNKLYRALQGNDLLNKALAKLTTRKAWKERPDKSRNIINAFALAYDEELFEGEVVGCLYHAGEKNSHLEEVCFNATEFYRGLLFKQQVKMKTDAVCKNEYGNFIVHVNDHGWKKIKLSDILAASSCFPAGFEPIIYPRDFIHGNLKEEELLKCLHIKQQTDDANERQFLKKPVFGLMDGGITDNQGLESMMSAQVKRIKNLSSFDPFDFMMVNDVGSHFMSPYKVPEMKKGITRQLTINGVIYILALLFIASILFLWMGSHGAIEVARWSITGFLCFILGAGILFTGYLLRGTTSRKSSFGLSKNFGEHIVDLLFYFLRKTGLNVLNQMVRARARSVITLNSDVFLKRIRFLLYESFYNSPLWKHRGTS